MKHSSCLRCLPISIFAVNPRLAVPSLAEGLALIRLHGALEKILVEPFRPDYKELLEEARASLEECGAL